MPDYSDLLIFDHSNQSLLLPRLYCLVHFMYILVLCCDPEIHFLLELMFDSAMQSLRLPTLMSVFVFIFCISVTAYLYVCVFVIP